MSRPIPDHVLDLAISKLDAGIMLKDIAAEVGFHRAPLSKALRIRRGYTIEHRYRPTHNAIEFDRSEMVERYLAGESVLSLSRRYGSNRKTISDHLKRIGIELRNGSEANSIRMASLSKEEKLQLTKAAHEAVKGREHSVIEKDMRAFTRQRVESHKGFLEDEIAEAIRDAGIAVEQQRAFGFYNIDIFAGNRIAVEVSTRAFGYVRRTRAAKFEELRELRVPLLYIHITSKEAGLLNLDKIVSDVQALNRLPSPVCEHRVVRCSVERFSRVRDNAGRFAVVPVPEEPTYTMVSEETI